MKVVNKDCIEEVSEALNNNEIVSFPTETVFGLAIRAISEENFNKLVKVKNRPQDKPFTLMCSNVRQVENYVEFTELSNKIIEKFVPGPLTLILKAKPNIPHFMDLGTGFIGIRIPDDEFILKLIDLVNTPLLVPSANPSSLPPAKTDEEVVNYFENKISLVVKGKSYSNIPSTIIKIDGNKLTLLREGTLKFEEIKKEIGYENCVRL